jgi:hypothetical protein
MEYRREERSREVERDRARLEMIAESWKAMGNDRKKCGGTGETGSPLTRMQIPNDAETNQ